MTSRSSRPLRLALAAVVGASGMALAPTPAAAAVVLSDGLGDKTTVIVTPSLPTMTNGNDGTDETIRLQALAGSLVAKVRFEYRTVARGSEDGGTLEFASEWQSIAVADRSDNGSFSTEWAGIEAAEAATRDVEIRAIPLDSLGVRLAEPTSVTKKDNTRQTDVRGVNLQSAALLPYFVQTYASAVVKSSGVALTTGPRANDSDSKTLTLGYYSGSTKTSEAGQPSVSDTPAGALRAELRIPNARNAGDALLVWSVLGSQAEDSEAFVLEEQKLGAITAIADRTVVSPGEQATVTVTVRDKSGRPITGAQVCQSLSTTNDCGAFAKDPVTGNTPEQGQLTDAYGQVVFQQSPGNRYSYFANSDSTQSYNSSTDVRSGDVVVEAYQADTTKITGASADGMAFDLDEVDNTPSTGTSSPIPGQGTPGDGDPTDITVQVLDQKSNKVAPSDNQVLQYYWSVTPFTGGTVTRYPSTGTSAGTSEGGGKYDVVVPSGGNGTYELFAALTGDAAAAKSAIPSSKVLTVKAGQAAIAWDSTSPQELPAGTTSQVTGKLALPDGSTLPGRAIDLTFQRDTSTTNEDTTPDAGFTSPNGGAPTLTTQVVTTAAGAIVAWVTDPAETPQLSELGDNIDAASAANSFGNAGATKNDQVVNFVADDKATAVTLTESRQGVTLRPGEFTLYTVKVTNRLGGGISGQKVTLTTDKGYFSKDDSNAMTTSPTPSPTPASGADAGTYQNDGKSLELTTGSDGTATVFLAMGRDTGFDDDGQVVSKVTATAGTLSANDDHAWTSSNPLNGGAVELVVSDKAQDSAILPKAQTSDEVYVDVLVTDQFGNAVGGENISLTDDSAGTIAESDGTANDGTIVSDFAKEGDATLTSATGTPQKVTASWATERLTYTGASTTTTPGTETLTDDYTVEWYEIDFAASDITFTPNGAGPREVGSSVTLTYEALDQLGQPISDLFIAFTRSGPGAGSDTSGSANTLTGADGTAAYTFVGSTPGRADVTATARRGSATGDVVSAASRTASVTFEEEQVDPVKPRLETTKRIKGNKLVIKVAVTASTQDPVQGTLVLTENGKRLLTRELNADGERKLVVRGLKKGFHSVRLTFQGNDLVRERSKTFTFTIR